MFSTLECVTDLSVQQLKTFGNRNFILEFHKTSNVKKKGQIWVLKNSTLSAKWKSYTPPSTKGLG